MMAARRHRRARGFDRRLHRLGQRHALEAQLQLASHDSRHVEQIVYQPHQLGHWRPSSRSPFADRRVAVAALLQQPERGHQGASGLRSSWASVARNSSFRRSDSASACSNILRSWTSITEPMKPEFAVRAEARQPGIDRPAILAAAVAQAVVEENGMCR